MKKLMNLTAITILATTTISHLTNTNFKENNNKAKNNAFQKNTFAIKTKIIKSDQQLFTEVKTHLTSFDDKNPFKLKGLGDNNTIEDVLKQIKANLQITFKENATRIKNLTMTNLNKTINDDQLLSDDIFLKNITFNIGINTASLDDIKMGFQIKSDEQLFNEVKSHLKSFNLKKRFALKGLSENNTIADVLNKINDNLKTTFGEDATRIKNLKIHNLNKTIKEDGLLNSGINWKYIAFSIGMNTTSFGNIKIYFKINSDWQLFNDVKSHLASFDDKKPFELKGISENNTITDVLNKINDNLKATFGEEFKRIKNLTIKNLDKTIKEDGLLSDNTLLKNITFSIGPNEILFDEIKIAFNIKSDQQLFNEVKNHLSNFNAKKPFKLIEFGNNNTIGNILNKINDNLKATFDKDFTRIQNLTIHHLDGTISNENELLKTNNWKNITFNIGSHKTSLNEIKITFNIKSDWELFDEIKTYLKKLFWS